MGTNRKAWKTPQERKKLYLDLAEKVDEFVEFGGTRKRYTCWKLLKIYGFTGYEHDEWKLYPLASIFPEFARAMILTTAKTILQHEQRKEVLELAAELCDHKLSRKEIE